MNYSHVIIGRAVGMEGSVQMKLGFEGDPKDGAEADIEKYLGAGYEQTFGKPPAEVAVAKLPYIPGEDDEDD